MHALLRRLITALVSMAVVAALATPFVAAGAIPPGNIAFQRTWERTDRPVAELRVPRTWIWGPSGNTGVIQEAYAESPGGMRAVQYFDKARMEITHQSAPDDGLWYVTTGLLAVELISGDMQMGDNLFETRGPAAINVAGDEDDTTGPTYATFTNLLAAGPAASGSTLTQRLSRAGTVTNDPTFAKYGVTAAHRVQVPGIDHQIASPFWEFMNSSGEVYENGRYLTEPIFEDPYYAIGYPISEAYWTKIKVAGTSHDVLVQVFERRVLTYTPANPAGWRVEMGNIGRHYYAWRYAQVPKAPASPTNLTLSVSNPTNCTDVATAPSECTYTLTLAWRDASNNEDGFKITTSFNTATYTAPANATTWSQAFPLKPGQGVTLSIVAWNEAGNSAKVVSNAVTPQAPTPTAVAAPSDVMLQASEPSACTFASGVAPDCLYTLTVTWDDESTNEDGFEIRLSFASTTYTVAAGVEIWTREFRLEPREWVSADVRAFNEDLQSAWVASEPAYLHEPIPAAPTDVTLAVSDPSDCSFVNRIAVECTYKVTATWTDQSNNEDGFRVRPDFTATTKRVGENVTTWTGTFRLQPREWISVQVQAYNLHGESEWVESPDVYLKEPTTPTAPTNVVLAISQPSDCTLVNDVPTECAYTLTLTWTDTVKDEDGFLITTTFNAETYLAVANATTWSKTFRLVPEKDVVLSIAAYNIVGPSSVVVSNKVTPLPTVLPVPEAPEEVVLTVSAPYDCEGVSWMQTCAYDVTLTWKDTSTTEAGFTIRRLPDEFDRLVAKDVTTLQVTERLHPATLLAYEVRAENAAGVSGWVRSNVVLLPAVAAGIQQ